MANSLLDLEKSLGRTAVTLQRATGSHKRTAKMPRSQPVAAPAPTSNASPAAPKAALAAAFRAVNFRVPGIVDPIRQPSPNTCWATVTTIMVNWRAQRSEPIPSVLGSIGAAWLGKFTRDQGLLGSEKASFLGAAGLAYEAPQSPSVQGWETLLRNYGPLWVTTDEDPTAGFAIHARVMMGIHGDGTPSTTSVDIVDPANGTAYTEKLSTFQTKFEAEAWNSKAPLRIQIVHFAADAGHSVARALSTTNASYAFATGTVTDDAIDEAEFEPGYDESRPAAHTARAASSFSFGLKSVTALSAADVRWAADTLSPDTRHLATPIDTTPFVLNGTLIARLAQLNRFAFADVDAKIVFGLRGCTLDSSQRTFVDSISVREIAPNHTDNRCVIGVWDSATGKVVAFHASTVPNWKYMEAYRQNHSRKANLLPCGKFDMVVGTHRPTKKNEKGEVVANPGRVQGALRNNKRVVVLRSEDDLTYTVNDTWDETIAFDNLHPGIVAVNSGASTVPDFSSAGCNTIPGASKSDVPSGDWAAFREALGLDNAHPTKDDGKRSFAYVLLSGRDARVTATMKEALAPARLRFGSSGADVRALQEALANHPKSYFKGTSDGSFGSGTAMAYIRYQKDRDGGAADCIVTPADATALGFSLTVPPAAPAPARQLGALGTIIDVARGIFARAVGAFSARDDEGRFAITSDIAEIMHDDTPSTQQWSKKTANFAFKAYSPQSGLKDLARLDIKLAKSYRFLLTLSFEFNGYDIRNAQIQRVIQGSSTMKDPKLEVKFTAKRATGARSEVSRIDFLMNGKWDPGVGDGFRDFGGKVWVESDGDIGIEFSPSTFAKQDYEAGGSFSSVRITKFPAPKIDRRWKAVFFAVDKDVIEEKELQLFKEWMRDLSKEKVRYQRLREGAISVNIDGFASPTGKGQHNQDLSRKRKEKVKKLVQDEFGSSVKIIDSAKGEANPGEKNESEDASQRRVDVWFEVAI